jgi:hypothetical protein
LPSGRPTAEFSSVLVRKACPTSQRTLLPRIRTNKGERWAGVCRRRGSLGRISSGFAAEVTPRGDLTHRGSVRDPSVKGLVDVAAKLRHRVDALRRGFGVEAPEQFGAHVRHVIDPGTNASRPSLATTM